MMHEMLESAQGTACTRELIETLFQILGGLYVLLTGMICLYLSWQTHSFFMDLVNLG